MARGSLGVILAVVAITWVAFWRVVVRLHLQQGDIAPAVVVSLLFVLPALIGYAYYLWPNYRIADAKRPIFGHWLGGL